MTKDEVIEYLYENHVHADLKAEEIAEDLAESEIIRCNECKHNPNITWFECPMSHLSESQRPETAWCWKAERRTDERFD